LTLNIALTTVLRTNVLHCDYYISAATWELVYCPNISTALRSIY